MSRLLLILAAFLLFNPTMLFAARFKGTRPATGVTETIAIPVTSDEDIDTTSSRQVTLRTGTKKNRLGLRDSNNKYLPVLLAVQPTGKRPMTVQKAIRLGLCNGAVGYMVAKKSARKMKFTVRGIEGDNAYANLKKFRISGKSRKAQTNLNKLVDKSATVELNSDCSPTGNATNSGFLGVVAEESVVLRAAVDGDSDEDGLPDLFDSDVDQNRILNPYESMFTFPLRSFYLFSNLKVGLEGTVNSNTGTTPTLDQVNNLLQNSSILAIEVKGDAAAGDISELDCGSLGYCSTGGTGEIALTSTMFPDGQDADSDGFGEITKGSTGDFQLQTGASLADLNGGDLLKQIVTETDGSVTNYYAKLDFVFKSTPAIKSIATDPDGDNDQTTISYPIAEGSDGTPTSCIEVAENGDSEIILEIVAWRPQRKGYAPIGETGDFYDVGGSEITIDIPNIPDPTLGSGAARMPNNCGSTTYTESDTNLEVADGKLVDTATDAAADPLNTVTFRVNVTDCLAESSDTIEIGDLLQLGLQFRSVSSSDGSDNAAVSFCIERIATM